MHTDVIQPHKPQRDELASHPRPAARGIELGLKRLLYLFFQCNSKAHTADEQERQAEGQQQHPQGLLPINVNHNICK